MEEFLKVVSLIIFYLFFVIVCSLTGLLFNLHEGAFVGVGLAILFLLFIFKYGEKIILLLSMARYITDDENLVNQIKNFCTHLEMKEIKVYWSNVYFNNVYFVNSYFGTPSIIIGKEVYNNLTKNELNSLIYATLLRIKSQDSKNRSMVNLITLCLFWWVFWLDKVTQKIDNHEVVKVFLYPAFYIRSRIYNIGETISDFDSEIFKHENLQRDYISALFKINKYETCLPLSVGAFVLTGLSHTYNTSNNPLLNIVICKEEPIEERVKTIAGNLR